jgi:hypothetical protein
MKVCTTARTSSAMRFLTALLSGVTLAACFVPANDVIVGRLDAGVDGGGAAAGGVSGGGTAAGGASGGGAAGGLAAGGSAGGFVAGAQLTILRDAGVIAPVGAPPAICNTHGVLGRELMQRLPRDAGCGNGCLFEVVEDGGTLAYRSDLGTTGEVLAADVANGERWEAALLTQLGSLQRRLVAIPLAGGAPLELERFAVGASVSVTGAWLQDSFFFTVSTGATSNAFKVWSAARGVVQLATLPSAARGRPSVSTFTGRALLALDDGLYVAPLSTPGVARRVHASSSITAWVAADTGGAYFAEQQGAVTSLFVLNLLAADPTPFLLGTGLDGVRAFAVNDQGNGVDVADELGVLTSSGVYLVAPSQRTARLIYAGGPFIQGYQKLEGLVFASGRYHVGEVCYPDADAPDWGTVELTPPSALGSVPQTPGASRWLTGTPEWPFRTPVVDRSSAGWSPRLPMYRTSRGGFVLRHVGD